MSASLDDSKEAYEHASLHRGDEPAAFKDDVITGERYTTPVLVDHVIRRRVAASGTGASLGTRAMKITGRRAFAAASFTLRRDPVIVLNGRLSPDHKNSRVDDK